MKRGCRKTLYRREKDSLEGPQEEAETQRKDLRRGNNLAFSEDTCLEKKRVRSKVTPRKVGVGLKRRREPSKRRLGWRLAKLSSNLTRTILYVWLTILDKIAPTRKKRQKCVKQPHAPLSLSIAINQKLMLVTQTSRTGIKNYLFILVCQPLRSRITRE